VRRGGHKGIGYLAYGEWLEGSISLFGCSGSVGDTANILEL